MAKDKKCDKCGVSPAYWNGVNMLCQEHWDEYVSKKIKKMMAGGVVLIGVGIMIYSFL